MAEALIDRGVAETELRAGRPVPFVLAPVSCRPASGQGRDRDNVAEALIEVMVMAKTEVVAWLRLWPTTVAAKARTEVVAVAAVVTEVAAETAAVHHN